ncbi:tetratricopeptide repeat protein [Thermodesulfobacteriota bacterium]
MSNYPVHAVRNQSIAVSFVGLAIFFLCLTIVPLSAWGTPVSIQQVRPLPPSIESLSSFLRKGQYAKVIQGSRTLLARNPEAPVFGMLSVASAALNRPEEAAKLQQKAKEIGEPRKALLDISRAMILNREGKQDAAIKACHRAIKLEPENPLAYLTLGLAYFAKKDYERAEQNLMQAVELEPQLAHAYTVLGAAYIALKKAGSALTAYLKAVKIDPQDARPHMGLATIYTGINQPQLAINEYETALRLNPSLHQARVRLARLYLRVGRAEDAIAQAQTVLEEEPKSAEAHYTLAMIFTSQNRFEEAVKHLEQVVSIQPKSFNGHDLLGLCLMVKGDLSPAWKHFQEARRLNTQHPEPAIALALIAHLEKDLKQAATWLKSALSTGPDSTDRLTNFLKANLSLSQKKWGPAEEELKLAKGFLPRFYGEFLDLGKHFGRSAPDSPAHTNLAAFYLIKGWPDQSMLSCDRALKQHPSNPLALYIKGKALLRKRDAEPAAEVFKRTEDLAPRFVSVHFELAEIFIIQGALPQAIETYQKVIELIPQEPAPYLRLGALYARAGKDQDATGTYRQVIRLAPESPVAYNELAYHFADKGSNLDEALTLAKKASELAPNNGAILDTLGWVYFQRREYQQAVKSLSQAVRRAPNLPTVRYHLGMAHFKNGDNQQALKAFRTALRISKKFPEAAKAEEMIKTIEGK